MSAEQKHTDMISKCCDVSCDRDAEFLVLTVRSKESWAGPDPLGDQTEACADHVGALLGWQPDCVRTDEVFWHVHPLAVTPPFVRRPLKEEIMIECIAVGCTNPPAEWYGVRVWDDDRVDPRYLTVRVGICTEHEYERNLLLADIESRWGVA